MCPSGGGIEDTEIEWDHFMKSLGTCSLLLLTVAALAPATFAAEKHAMHSAAKNSAFDKFKSLVGDWDIVQAAGEHAMPNGVSTYRLTAGGSAVVETVFKGTEHEMTTVYYIDSDGGLCLTHYCILGNQPHMRALPQPSDSTVVLQCRHEDNAAIENDDHMGKATFTFVDPDHVKSEWVLYSGGKPASSHSFTLVRKKK
jgi:hypothetical protein